VEDTLVEDAAIADWCRRVTAQKGLPWRYVRVSQTTFGDGRFPGFRELLRAVEGRRRLPV
jgi:hypothetical protein